MEDKATGSRRHESVDHQHPTDAGMMEPDAARHPATGVMGDETIVRMTGGGIPPYPGVDEGHDEHGEGAEPGPTDWDALEARGEKPRTTP